MDDTRFTWNASAPAELWCNVGGVGGMRRSRREILLAGGTLLAAPFVRQASARAAPKALRVTGVDLLPIRATSRTVWLIVRLRTDGGLVGLGEASDAFGFANTTIEDATVMRAQLQTFCRMIEGRSPLEIEAYRQRALPLARQGLVAATAFSAIEQAMWDLTGKALDVPVHVLFGGKVRDALPVYANVNRATTPRTRASSERNPASPTRSGTASRARSPRATPASSVRLKTLSRRPLPHRPD